MNNRIEKAKLINRMKELSEVYDIVRTVNPMDNSVIVADEKGLHTVQKQPCFSVWEKNSRCSNCISLKACLENRRITKFEFRNNEAYSVIAIPYSVIDGENEYTVSLELVNHIDDNLVLEADGLDVKYNHIMNINQKLYQDSLTGTFNRRYFDEFRYIYEMSHTMPTKIGFLVLDIKHFKEINGYFGRACGDELLTKIAEAITLNVRNTDRVMRIGGDEFLIVLRDCEKQFVEKKVFQLKRAVSKLRLPWMVDFSPAIAVGMSYSEVFSGKQDELVSLFELADMAMISDKKKPDEDLKETLVLIVDDTEMTRKIVADMISTQYKTIEASNGKEALDIIKSQHIDLIITDIFMPVMNGYELMQSVKAIPKFRDIPIVAITEKAETSQNLAIESGADIYIDRPLGGFHLLETIQKLTGKDHGRKDLFDMDFVLETIPGAIIIYKFHNNFFEVVSCSRGINQIIGWESYEICNMTSEQNLNSIYPSDIDKLSNSVKRMVHTHSRAEVIFRCFRKDRSIVWLWFQGRYIGEEDGCPIVEAIILDVSNNTNMYQSILDAAESLITVVDAHNFEVLYVNEMAARVAGISKENYIGSTCFKKIMHRDSPCDECIFHHTEEDFHQDEFCFNNSYYRRFFKRINWHGVDAYLEYVSDISAEKQNIAYAEKEKNLQTQILNNIPVGIIVYCLKDNEITAVEANDLLCDMMSIDRDKLPNSKNDDFFVLVHKDDIELVKKATSRLYIPNSDEEYEFRSFDRKNNRYTWMNGHGRSELQPDGSVFIYFAYRDISERKELEAAQRKLIIAEKEAAAKADFYSRMSHDLRTPMNGILGIAELSTEEMRPEVLRENIAKIKDSGTYLLGLINDTLDYQRIQSGRLTLNPEIVDTRDVIRNIEEMIRLTAEKKGVSFIVKQGNVDVNWYIKMDVMRLKQIFINLLSNAVKFTPTGGTVEFSMQLLKRDNMISHDLITIRDNGIGMSESFLKNEIFKPFSQEFNSTTTQYAGSGLGLSIAKSIIELMGGKIEVQSELGEGSTFSIYLDFLRVDKAEAEEYLKNQSLQDKHEDISLAGSRVLLAEDHPLNAEIVKRLLDRINVSVDWVTDGKECTDKFLAAEDGYYDAILMDIRMPHMDGLEATKYIRANEKKNAKPIPIIAMSANAYDEDIRKSLEVGMNLHLAKPVEPQVLYHALVQIIKK